LAYNGKRRPRGDDLEQWELFFEVNPDRKDEYPDKAALFTEPEPEKKRRGRPKKETIITEETTITEEPAKVNVPRKKIDEYKVRDGTIHINLGEDEHINYTGADRSGKTFWSDTLQARVNILTINGENGIACVGIFHDCKIISVDELNKLKLRTYDEKVMLGDSVVLNENTKLKLNIGNYSTDKDPNKKYSIGIIGSMQKIKLID